MRRLLAGTALLCALALPALAEGLTDMTRPSVRRSGQRFGPISWKIPKC